MDTQRWQKCAKGHANGCRLGNATLRRARFQIRPLGLSSRGGNLSRLVNLIKDKEPGLGALANKALGFLVRKWKRQRVGVRGSQKDSGPKEFVSRAWQEENRARFPVPVSFGRTSGRWDQQSGEPSRRHAGGRRRSQGSGGVGWGGSREHYGSTWLC